MEKLFAFLYSLRKAMFFWIKPKTIESEAANFEGNELPKLYVFYQTSLIDRLILSFYCFEHSTPVPLTPLRRLRYAGQASSLSLTKPGFWKAGGMQARDILTNVLGKVKATGIELVPVGIYWGQDPGLKSGVVKSKMMKSSLQFGWFRRMVQFILRSRHGFIHIEKPLILTGDGSLGSIDKAVAYTVEVLEQRFQKQQHRVLGETIYSHQELTDWMLEKSGLNELVKEDDSAREKARIYIKELAARHRYRSIMLLRTVVTYVFGKMFTTMQVEGVEQVRRAVDAGSQLVFVGAHRSHFDYMIVNYLLHENGLPTPHTAAGKNLDFFPVGNILRGGGAFYIRRKFGADRLYNAVFSNYIRYLVEHGHILSFFPEGGRSRTGLLLKPKLGMLTEILKALPMAKKPVVFVPFYISYEKVLESDTYRKELGGAKKASESLTQIRKTIKRLSSCGHVYLRFGEPITHRSEGDAGRAGFAQELMSGVNRIVTPTAAALLALSWIALGRRNVDTESLKNVYTALYQYLADAGYSYLPGIGAFESALGQGLELAHWHTRDGGVGILPQAESNAIYISRSVLHLFLPAIQSELEGLGICYNHLRDQSQILQMAEGKSPVFALSIKEKGAIVNFAYEALKDR